MLICSVECVAKVHHERVGLPTKAIFDGRVGELRSVEKVACCDAQRMRAPKREVFGVRRQFVD